MAEELKQSVSDTSLHTLNELFEYQSLMEAIDNGIEGFSVHDVEGDFTYVNRAEAHLYGYEPEELIGQSWRCLYDANQVAEIEQIYFPQLMEAGHCRAEIIGKKKTGEFFDVEISLNIIRDGSGGQRGLFCACRDISARKRAQEEVDYLAFHDVLTGLPNRSLFNDRMEQAIIHAKRVEKFLAVLLIDLDHFKHVNDTFGHSFGDDLLRAVTKRLTLTLREDDTVARLGGDEFTVLLPELNKTEHLEVVVNKIIGAFKAPFMLGGHEIYQSLSIGVSFYPNDGADNETLLKNADAAMYQVKAEGRQGYRRYTAGLTDVASDNIWYRSQLLRAVEQDEFELHYQPLISLDEHRVVGAEALIRWRHPEMGLVYPDKFIRFAEESSLIVPIGNIVIERACQQFKQWQAEGLMFDYVAINVSGLQLRSGFAEQVDATMKKMGVLPSQLELEITETFLMQHLHHASDQLAKLKALGLSISIDDFGTGYSSLSQIKQLPIETIKVDRSFVGDIVEDSDDRAIVEAVIAMGRALNLTLLAEGIETQTQHEMITALGSHKAQGYFYSKPVRPHLMADIFAEINQRLQ